MRCRYLLSLFLKLVLLFPLWGQELPDLPGARAASVGVASVTFSDIWSVRNNIGALAGLEKAAAAFTYNTRLNIQELTTMGALAAFPLYKGMAAASFTRYGTGPYSLQEMGIGYSHKIGSFSLGVKLNYLQQSIEKWESRGKLVLEAGGKAELLPSLHFAAHAYNLSQSAFSHENGKMIPVLLKAGLAFIPSRNLQLLVQSLKELESPARFSAGLEYRIVDALQIRTGLLTAPFVASFGLGYLFKKFGFDYAFRHHNTIGAAHHISFHYTFSPPEQP